MQDASQRTPLPMPSSYVLPLQPVSEVNTGWVSRSSVLPRQSLSGLIAYPLQRPKWPSCLDQGAKPAQCRVLLTRNKRTRPNFDRRLNKKQRTIKINFSSVTLKQHHEAQSGFAERSEDDRSAGFSSSIGEPVRTSDCFMLFG